jgi:hypothetical protein
MVGAYDIIGYMEDMIAELADMGTVMIGLNHSGNLHAYMLMVIFTSFGEGEVLQERRLIDDFAHPLGDYLNLEIEHCLHDILSRARMGKMVNEA